MVTIEVLTSEISCSKCDQAMKVIQEIIRKYKDKVKMIETDILKNQDKVITYNVMSTPAVIINKKLVCEGIPNEEVLIKRIEESLK